MKLLGGEMIKNRRVPEKVVCECCGKSFTWKSNLQRHILSVHEQKKNINQKEYACDICSRKFSKKFNLNRHISFHRKNNNTTSNTTQPIHCCMCSYTSPLKTILLEHYNSCHGIELSVEKLKFKNTEEFESWKEGIEKSDVSKYVLQQSRKQTDTNILQYYHCHRDGFYKKSGNNIRRLKLTGSIKINTHCPSKMNIIISKVTGEVSVKFVRQHLGHKMELEKIPLSKKTQDNLAEKLKQKIPFDEVLNDVRDNVVVENLDRLHLLTRQDLFNIERKYNLSKDCVRHSNNCSSVAAWVEKARQKSYYSVVRFYKGQGEESDIYSDVIEPQDFLLIIMNEAQLNVFKKYGNYCVCVDSTRRLNPLDFELITVMVPYEGGEGFPCLFAFTNRSDTAICRLIFEILKSDLGDSQVTPTVFMSEMGDSYYDGWKAVMGPVNSRFFCTWHVTEDWNKNIQNKISDPQSQDYATKTLKILMEEQDPIIFEDMLEKWMNDLCDPELKEFGEWFKVFYAPTRKCWANCFRLRVGLNTNMHLERMHMTLEYIYMKGHTAKRPDKVIHAIMRLMREKLFEQLLISNKVFSFSGKVCSKLKDLQKRHKNIEELVAKKIQIMQRDATHWSVVSSDGVELYRIELSRKSCSCDYKCHDCETCIHKYICSCIDSSIKWNMCKHIHLLCQHLRASEEIRTEEQATEEINTEEQATDEINTEEQATEFEKWPVAESQSLVIYEEFGGNQKEGEHSFLTSPSVEDRKEAILKSMKSILESITTNEECDILEQLLAPVQNTLTTSDELI
nr:uncharacterized protein LOC111504553 isoform X1 [Leptinotarsa decemlineata]